MDRNPLWGSLKSEKSLGLCLQPAWLELNPVSREMCQSVEFKCPTGSVKVTRRRQMGTKCRCCSRL